MNLNKNMSWCYHLVTIQKRVDAFGSTKWNSFSIMFTPQAPQEGLKGTPRAVSLGARHNWGDFYCLYCLNNAYSSFQVDLDSLAISWIGFWGALPHFFSFSPQPQDKLTPSIKLSVSLAFWLLNELFNEAKNLGMKECPHMHTERAEPVFKKIKPSMERVLDTLISKYTE